ncbi:MAG TPA: cyclodeaminase/cyclohydrolase family protein, partial [Gemmatimonadales bacterium]|nr:cyclodeaminase/cyclohydrolase family protein [Gemmatimonadales bacterium]
ILAEAETLRGELRQLADDDAVAYGGVSAAYKVPKENPSRPQVIDQALLGAARTPLAMARAAVKVIALAKEIGSIGNKNASSDAGVGVALGRAALAGSLANVRINVASLSDASLGKPFLAEAEELERSA